MFQNTVSYIEYDAGDNMAFSTYFNMSNSLIYITEESGEKKTDRR